MLNAKLYNTKLRIAVRLALTGSSFVASFEVANAQTAPAVAANYDTAPQEVVVTGLRIAVLKHVSTGPVTFVAGHDVQESFATRVEDLLYELPQVFASQGANKSDGASGTAGVDLRGLGPERTLILVDGMRLGPGDPRALGVASGAPDINTIPVEIIDSTEVLTGGASSTYGADAVGGVVNFKLNEHFEGVKLITNGGFYNHENKNTESVEEAITKSGFLRTPSSVNPGAQKSLAFIAGMNSEDGKGNATFYANRNVNAVLQSQCRDCAWTLNSGFLAGASKTHGSFTCDGSSASFPGRFEHTDWRSPALDVNTDPRAGSDPTSTVGDASDKVTEPDLGCVS